MKKLFGLVLVVSLLFATGCGCDKKEKENNTVDTTPANIADTKVKKLDVIDFVTINENNISTVYYAVENNTEESINYSTINCKMYDKNGDLIYTLTSELGNLEPNESKDISMNVSVDLSKVASVKYNVE